MTAVAELLADCRRVGLSVERHGDNIALEADTAPPAEFLERLREAKGDLLALLPDEATRRDQLDFEERSAIVEYDGSIPRAWAQGFARLDTADPPADVPPARWQRFLDDCGRFLDSAWPAQAAALGWGPLDLFGCNDTKPYARIDQAGLLWLLDGFKISALTAKMATVESRNKARQTYRRRLSEPGRVLAWDLVA